MPLRPLIVPMFVLLAAVASPSRMRAEEQAPPAAVAPTVIDDAAAADHVGEECVVEIVVRAARTLDDAGMCFLNSRKDRREEGNFTAVIFKGGLERFKAAGIEDPANHFLDRRIRVRGVIATHKERPQIVVDEPAQIEVVDAPAAPEPERTEPEPAAAAG